MIKSVKSVLTICAFLLVSHVSVFAQYEKPEEVEEKSIYQFVDEEPQFPGGIQGMAKFIQRNLVYPQVAIENNLEGKCYVKFVVDKKGNVKKAVVERGVHGCPECDAEALRVVNMMPKWKPGKVGKKKVNCYFRLPINYQLE
jgi:protein TonB